MRSPHKDENEKQKGLICSLLSLPLKQNQEVIDQVCDCKSEESSEVKSANGGTVDSVVPWLSDTACSSLLPLWPMAHLEGTPIQRINHFLTFGAYDYFQFSNQYLSLSLFQSLIFLLVLVLLRFNLLLFCRRFVGFVFGAKGTNAISSVEYFCCDRPNPILQVSFFFPETELSKFL